MSSFIYVIFYHLMTKVFLLMEGFFRSSNRLLTMSILSMIFESFSKRVSKYELFFQWKMEENVLMPKVVFLIWQIAWNLFISPFVTSKIWYVYN